VNAVYFHTISSFFRSPFKVLSVALFILILNLFLWVIPSSSILDFGFADLSLFFSTVPFIFLIFIPSLFMNFVVEDFENGMSDWLFSKPLTPLNYWLGHVLSGLTIIFLFLILSLSSYFSIYFLASNIGEIDHLQIISSYFGIWVLALVFTAISTFASSISKNQSGAFLLSVLLCYFFLAIPSFISELPILVGNADYILKYFSLDSHLEILSRGIVEMKSLIYFATLIVLFSFFAIRNIEKRLR